MKAIGSHPGVRSDLFNRRLSDTRITDFFGGVEHVEVTEEEFRHIPVSTAEEPFETEEMRQTVKSAHWFLLLQNVLQRLGELGNRLEFWDC